MKKKLTKPQLFTLAYLESVQELVTYHKKGSIPLQNLWRKCLVRRYRLKGTEYQRKYLCYSWQLSDKGKRLYKQNAAQAQALLEEYGLAEGFPYV